MKSIRQTYLMAIMFMALFSVSAQNVPQNGATVPAAGVNLAVDMPVVALNTGDVINYVRSYDFYKAYLTMPQDVTGDPAFTNAINNGDIIQTTTFLDGLGRNIQTVLRQGSGTGKDLVSFMSYDGFGRPVFQPMPYAELSATDGNFQKTPSADQASFLSGHYTGETIFYGKTEFEPSPLNRVLKQMAPGNSWTGNDVGVSTLYRTNTADDGVRVWLISGGNPVTASTYAPGELTKVVSIDENGHAVRTFTDKRGQVILKQVQKGATSADDHSFWLNTYYIYDRRGNLHFVLPPKAVELLDDTYAWLYNPNNFNDLVFKYTYDGRNRMITKQVPGAGRVDMVYDKMNRLVVSQDANQRLNNQWTYKKYDVFGRPVITGFISSAKSRTDLQTEANNSGVLSVSTEPLNMENVLEANSIELNSHVPGTQVYRATEEITIIPGFYSDGEAFDTEITPGLSSDYTFVQGYYDATFPSLKDYSFEVNALSYYDNYEQINSEWSTGYTGFSTGGGTANAVVPQQYTDVTGLSTGSRVRVLGTEDYLTTAMFYDDRNRVVQVQSDNHLTGTDATTTQYDFSGQVLHTYTVHNNPFAGPDETTRVLNSHSYDEMGRLMSVEEKLNDTGSPKTIVAHTYNELGELEKKALGSGIEDLNYTYNIRGWLKNINGAYLADPEHVDQEHHYFGMDLSYNFGFSQDQLNGNITGVKWRSRSSSKERAYGFRYDATNRLTEADYYQNESSLWTNTNVDFSTNYTYDTNGNILTLNRKTTTFNKKLDIDQLTYFYKNGDKSNQLDYVQDLAGFAGQGDFKGDMGTTSDYQYDANGNMVMDRNKDILDNGLQYDGIQYNHLNLPELIRFQDNPDKTIRYVYDAAGIKLQKVVNDNGNLTTTDYVGGFIYENNKLQHFAHAEGRVRKNDEGDFIYDYFIKDHLGNTRMTLTEEVQPPTTYLATMELAYRDWETSESQGLGFGNIYTGNTVVNSAANVTTDQFDELEDPAPNMALRTNGSYPNLALGATKLIKVMVDDVVHVEAYAQNPSVADNGGGTLGVTGSILGMAFGGVSGGAGTDGAIYDLFNDNYSSISAGLLSQGNPSNSSPKAYLNWILFDEDFNVVNSGTGYGQVGNGSTVQHLQSPSITVQSSGYFYVYVSNESTNTIYFDDVRLEHTKGQILQEDHYYPFGLNINALSSSAPLSKPNKFKYNGNEEQTEFDLNLYDFNARMYDPVLGRFNSIDPLSEKRDWLTPYNFAQNSPMLRVDPNGLLDNSYYDENGEYLGTDYETDTNEIKHDEIRIISREEWEKKKDGTTDDDGVEKISTVVGKENSTRFSEKTLEDEAIINIVSHINDQLADGDKTKKEFEWTAESVENSSMSASENYRGNFFGRKFWFKGYGMNINTKDGKVVSSYMNNVGNVKNLLVHEHRHLTKGFDGSEDALELDAYQHQRNHSTYEGTTIDVKNMIDNKIKELTKRVSGQN